MNKQQATSNKVDPEVIDAEVKSVALSAIVPAQVQVLTMKTDPREVRERTGRGGSKQKYVDYAYVTRTLNQAFGWNWDFEVETDELVIVNEKPFEARVRGRLTVKLPDGQRIVKTQYGSQTIEFTKNDATVPVSIGDAYKGAATDCFKKCASLLGVALDVYDTDSELYTNKKPVQQNQTGNGKAEPTREELLKAFDGRKKQAEALGIEVTPLADDAPNEVIITRGQNLSAMIRQRAPKEN